MWTSSGGPSRSILPSRSDGDRFAPLLLCVHVGQVEATGWWIDLEVDRVELAAGGSHWTSSST